ncbi:PAS domain-containing sensor histidine kinase [Nocardioides sp. Root240]|uniref:sensor histidine kinase n=1 Tax=Nocardioides sp. Root240 TaxID=1736500 RepID=UPI0007030C14|nr:PAS domain-containing sensor histidine kinase [Nocardioides sp. Root240]KRC76703.1 PAS domain-containing sensor histidine kinase [Nocardioides sp. Root240]
MTEHPDHLDLLPDGVVVADAEGTVTAINAVAAGMLDAGPPAQVVGRPLAEVLALTDHDGQAWTDANAPYDGLPTRKAVPEQAWLLPDGTEVLVTARLHRPVRIGPVASVAISLRSGRGRARLDRDRSDLVATLAHELRSPLTGVKGFVQALLARWDKLTDEQKKLMLTMASADADRLSRLITELLDVARIDTGRLQLHRRPTDVVKKVLRVQESISVATSTPVEVDAEADLPLIDADPDKVIQVVTNLVENAVRHGSGPVRIHVGRWADDPSYVAVTVTDEGEGIPEELRKRIFTKFWTGSARSGSGLGLYIVRGLVKAHGGTVTVDDRPGGGARVLTAWPQAE